MIRPDYHPHADALAQKLTEHFGLQAFEALKAMQQVLGNAKFMQVMEAFACVHRTTFEGDVNQMLVAEGARRLVLDLHAAKDVTENMIKEVLNHG